jgi:hypothetical protein
VIWLPCGGPASRYPGRQRRWGYSDSPADQSAWSRVNELIESLNRKQAEIERLKEASHHQDSRDSFEGVE